jgi:hypothetical protein
MKMWKVEDDGEVGGKKKNVERKEGR